LPWTGKKKRHPVSWK